MGYACPVCDEPQRDAEHLANHLAFQAMTHGDDHESWLDEHVPDWASGGPRELAPRVADLAETAEYDVVFEDTTEDRKNDAVYDPDLQGGLERGHEHEHGHGHGGTGRADRDLDPAAREILEDARSLTREMLDSEEDAGATDEE